MQVGLKDLAKVFKSNLHKSIVEEKNRQLSLWYHY